MVSDALPRGVTEQKDRTTVMEIKQGDAQGEEWGGGAFGKGVATLVKEAK